jgi:hypothetical protein
VIVNPELGKGVGYDVVDVDDCSHDLKPFRDSINKYSTPTFQSAHCTGRMKSEPSDKYCNDKYGKRGYTKWLGMRIDEPRRIKTVTAQLDMFGEKTKQKLPPIHLNYLGNISDFEKQDILDWWKQQPFDLDLQESLGNCVFCVKKGAVKLAYAAYREPELAARFIEMVNADSVPLRGKEKIGIQNDLMYRNHNSLESIIETYKDFDRDLLEKEAVHGRRNATESCSESCEATFSMDLDDAK